MEKKRPERAQHLPLTLPNPPSFFLHASLVLDSLLKVTQNDMYARERKVTGVSVKAFYKPLFLVDREFAGHLVTAHCAGYLAD